MLKKIRLLLGEYINIDIDNEKKAKLIVLDTFNELGIVSIDYNDLSHIQDEEHELTFNQIMEYN